MAEKNCNRCSKQIYNNAWKTARGKHYHPECFTCAICGSIIQSVPEDYNLKEIYCLQCYDKYFNKNEELNANVSEDSYMKSTPCPLKHISSSIKQNDTTFESPSCGSSTAVHQQCYFDNLQEKYHEIVDQNASNDLTSIKVSKDELWPTQKQYTKKTHETLPLRSISEERSMVNVISGTDLSSDRLKKTSRSKKFLIKPETPTVSPVFTSRIPRLTSLSKLIPPTPPQPDLDRGIKRSDHYREMWKQSETQPSFYDPMNQSTTPTSTKINEYLKSKGSNFFEKCIRFPKPRSPLKANHSCIENFNFGKLLNTSMHKIPPSSTANKIKKSNPQSLNLPPSSLQISQHNLQRSNKGSSIFLKLPTTSSFPSSDTPRLSNTNNVPQKNENIETVENTGQNNRCSTRTTGRLIVLPSSEQLIYSILGTTGSCGTTNNNHESLRSTTEKFTSLPSSSVCHDNNKGINRQGFLDCPICFEPLITVKSGKCLGNSVTGCGHIFHQECIYSWLISGNNRCPICSKLCLRDSISPVYLDVNMPEKLTLLKTTDNDEIMSLLSTLRIDYKELESKYAALVEEHTECGIKATVTSSLRSAYEMECRSRVQLQWQNKRLQRTIDELRAVMVAAQGDNCHLNTAPL